MRPIIPFFLFVLLLTQRCRKDKTNTPQIAYDIILVMGQSNTHYGDDSMNFIAYDSPRVLQLSRTQSNDQKIIAAKEPLDHHTKAPNKVGFAMTFASLYSQTELEKNRNILLIPCGCIGSGFINNRWNKGNDLYQDAVLRYTKFQRNFPNSKLVAVLWHQGEEDVENPNYQHQLDQFIVDFRKSIQSPQVPFILGGMVPYWVEQDANRQHIQKIIKNVPYRIPHCGYADPTYPVIIKKTVDSINSIHYDANGLYELGQRYFLEYLKIKS